MCGALRSQQVEENRATENERIDMETSKHINTHNTNRIIFLCLNMTQQLIKIHM